MKSIRATLVVAAGCLLAVGSAAASTVLGLTIEDQARLSKYVVIGEIAAQRGVDHPENGLETEVTLKVGASLKGDLKPGSELMFHTRSGELDGVSSIAVGEAVFHTGQKVLVFVEDVDGRLYNIGLSYGVFDVAEDANGRLAFRRAIQDDLEVVADAGVGNGPFTLEDIRTRVAFASKHPHFDNDMVQSVFGQGR